MFCAYTKLKNRDRKRDAWHTGSGVFGENLCHCHVGSGDSGGDNLISEFNALIFASWARRNLSLLAAAFSVRRR
jgi:hypothetical protein